MAQEITLEEKELFLKSISQKLVLGEKINNIKQEIDSTVHELKLIKFYKKYQQPYKEYKEILDSKFY